MVLFFKISKKIIKKIDKFGKKLINSIEEEEEKEKDLPISDKISLHKGLCFIFI